MAVSSASSLRERKKAQTRQTIQQEALRLFLAKGYAATSVAEISAAAGVSHMTFFRYFPTKEDVVLADDYDPLLVELIAARPAEEPAFEKVWHAMADGLARIYATDRDALLTRTTLILSTPALRARLWEQQTATERLIVNALASDSDPGADDIGLRVVASACLAAFTTAASIWVEGNGEQELPSLVEETFFQLYREIGATNG